MELKAALVQTHLAWEDPQANREHLDAILASLTGNPDLIVLPEMFSSGFTMDPQNLDPGEAGKTLEWMRSRSSQAGAALAGSLVWPVDGGYYNRFVFMEPDGTFHTYDKRHTFTLAGEDRVYKRGNRNVQVAFRGFVFSLQVCYDLRFPVWSRNTSGYDALIYVANWPDTRVGAWDALLRARAIENMAYVLGVNRIGSDPNGLRYSGHTAAYDPLGERLGFSDSEEVVLVRLEKEQVDQARLRLRFLDDRDPFTPGW